MWAEFKAEAETIRTDIDNTKKDEDKATKYRDLAEKANTSFNNTVDNLIQGEDWEQLKKIVNTKIDQMNHELENDIYFWELGKNIDKKITWLITLWTISKESLDNLVDTWYKDFSWDYNIDKGYQMTEMVDFIMDSNIEDLQVQEIADSWIAKPNNYRRNVAERWDRINEAIKKAWW